MKTWRAMEGKACEEEEMDGRKEGIKRK